MGGRKASMLREGDFGVRWMGGQSESSKGAVRALHSARARPGAEQEKPGAGGIAPATPAPPSLAAAEEKDGALLRRLREHRADALAAVVQAHARGMYRAARAMGVTAEDAEDVVQDVFVRFLESLDRFAGRSQLRTWLWGILRNRLHEYWRERKREQPLSEGDEAEDRFDAHGRWRRPPGDLHRLLESEMAGAAIRNCLQDLGPEQREVFVLREIEARETRDISTLLGVTANYCGVLIYRARMRLRDCLERAGWGPVRP